MKTTIILLGIGLSVIMLASLVFGVMKITVNAQEFRNANSALADKTDVKIEVPIGVRLFNTINRPLHSILAQAFKIETFNVGNTNNNSQLPAGYRMAILPPEIKIVQPFRREYLPRLS